jgi:hypothetical protein
MFPIMSYANSPTKLSLFFSIKHKIEKYPAALYFTSAIPVARSKVSFLNPYPANVENRVS